MLKRILTIAAIVFAVSGLALANVVDIDQVGVSAGPSGNINLANIQQSGYGNSIDLDQTAGSYNEADVDQAAYNDSIGINQNASTYNKATVEQKLSSTSTSTIAVTQTAAGGENEAEIHQLYGNGERKWITLVQIAGTYNHAYVMQDSGKQTEMTIHQNAGTYNDAHTEQYGSAWDSRVRVYQDAGTYNQLDVTQNLGGAADYSMSCLDQDATLGYNYAYFDNQDTTGGRIILAQAHTDGSSLGSGTYATQDSSEGNNDFSWRTDGGDNTFALYQQAVSDNWADVEQYNGNNFLGVYQTNSSGGNSLDSYQTGSMSATVIQTNVSGDGTISVSQN